MGRRAKRTLPQGQFETYAYNNASQLISRTDFNGKTTAYDYDNLNRLTKKTPDASFGAAAVQYTYTLNGQRETMSDGHGTTAYTYNTRDWLLSKATPEGTLTYTYDAAGNLATMQSASVNGVSMTYTYDTLNRLATAADNRAAGATNYTYDDVGNLKSFAYPNGVAHTYTYNTLNRLTNLTGSKGAQTLAGYAYTLGASGNRTGVTETGGRTLQYTYDDIYRLTGETIAGVALSGAISYLYDAAGNRMTRSSTVPSVASVTQSYSNNDWLNSDTYDSNGNTTQSDALTYTHDYENRIASASNGVQILYDGDGNRVSKTFNGVTTRYLVDTNNLTGYAQVLEELIATNQVVKVYGYGSALISQTVAGAGLSFYGFDGHGSVRHLTDLNGVVTDTYTYDAFGILIGRTGTTDNNYLYCGEQYDPQLGFYYLRARYMNPNSGRFMSMDSFGGNLDEPQSLHKYVYCNNNPVNGIDPSGYNFTASGAIGGLSIQSILATSFAIFTAVVLTKDSRLQLAIDQSVRGLFAAGAGALAAIGETIQAAARDFAKAIDAVYESAASAIKDLADKISRLPIFFVIESTMPHIYAFDVAALASNPSWFVLNYNGPYSMTTAANRVIVRAKYSWMRAIAPTGSQLDEFPFASTAEGGVGALAAMVPWLENSAQGGYLSVFYQYQMRGIPGPFLVVPVPI